MLQDHLSWHIFYQGQHFHGSDLAESSNIFSVVQGCTNNAEMKILMIVPETTRVHKIWCVVQLLGAALQGIAAAALAVVLDSPLEIDSTALNRRGRLDAVA